MLDHLRGNGDERLVGFFRDLFDYLRPILTPSGASAALRGWFYWVQQVFLGRCQIRLLLGIFTSALELRLLGYFRDLFNDNINFYINKYF